jgi:copper chaperone CopZ
MKRIFLLASFIISFTAKSQVTKVYLQASGLTCSMCSNAINKSLQTLDFVDNIDANLNNYTFEITFKENSKVEFDKLKKKVEDAGFFVSGFVAAINFENVALRRNQPLTVGANKIL